MHLHNMTTLFNNLPYISSSGMPVGTKFTAIYVRLFTYLGVYLFYTRVLGHWKLIFVLQI